MNEFVELVEKMRDAQRKYFQERASGGVAQAQLVESKILERKVDLAIQKLKADASAAREREEEEEVPW